jgi:hypothetical protein
MGRSAARWCYEKCDEWVTLFAVPELLLAIGLIASAVIVLVALIASRGTLSLKAVAERLGSDEDVAVDQFVPVNAVDLSPDEMPLHAKGIHGSVMLFDDHIRIEHSGLGATFEGGSGEEIVPLQSVAKVLYKKPFSFANGYVRFLMNGEPESQASTWSAMHDRRCVFFARNTQRSFDRLVGLLTGKGL